MKSNTLFTCSCLIFVLIMSACSQVKYTHLNKIQRQKQTVDQQFFVHQLKENERAAIVVAKCEQPEASTSLNENEVVISDVNTNKKEVNKRKNKVRISRAVDPLPSNTTLPAKVLTKLPAKLQAVFSKKENIAGATSTTNFSIFWAIVAALVVFWGLGWALSGSGIVHVLIVIAIILVLLRLIGVFS